VTLLTALVTHLPAREVDLQLDYLRAVAPESRFVVCHGGEHAEFERVGHDEKLFVEDPSLRGPWMDQSYNEVLTRVHDEFVAPDLAIDALFLLEYDHVVLRGGYEDAFGDVLDSTGADFLGKNCVCRDASNWMHSVRARRDGRFTEFLRSVSVRGQVEPSIYGALGGGFVVRRRALEAFRAVEHPPGVYLEVYMPTLLHHLGFVVDDFDRVSDIYDEVVHGPPKTFEEVLAARDRGRFFVHPFKDVARLRELMPPLTSSSQ
jgi:hypothetical protein